MSIKNSIWSFFRKSESDLSKAECNECKKLYSLGSDKPRLQTISGLKNHLQKCHPEANIAYLKRSSEFAAEQSARKKIKLDTSESRIALSNDLHQPTLKQLSNRQCNFPDETVQRIDKSVMDLIIVDMLPFSVVEGEAFKRLNLTDPAGIRRYKLKSEKFYRTTLLQETYEKVSDQVKNLLGKVEWVSFTTDAWSNPTKTCSLLSFTAHFVHDAVLRKVILSVSVLEDDHTGAYLASKLTEAIAAWNLESKVHIGVRDNAANMVSAMNIAGIRDMGCMAHTLALVVKDALFTQKSVENLVKKARKIVCHFKHSEQACRKLVICQKSCELPEHKLLQDIETRWNSTHVMLDRLCEQRKAVNLYCIEHGNIDTLSASEWELAERIVTVLKPFYDATLEISSDKTCISVMIPMTTMLLSKLEIRPEDRGLQQLKAALRDAMNRRFDFVKKTSVTVAATLLDPRFKDAYFNSQEKADAVAEVMNFLRSVDADANSNKVQPPSSSSSPVAATASQSSTLWDEHDNMNIATGTDNDDELPQYEQQLTSYMNEPRVPRSTDIFQYWKCSQYPLVEVAANKYLSAPPSSVASEQLFSSAGQVYADRRSSLKGENAERLLFLAYNIRLFNFNY